MTITAYSYSKKLKSTGIPGSDVTKKDITATLKDGADVLEPTFTFTATGWNSNYNYVKASLGGKTRYYRVTGSRHVTNDIIEISCSEDKMATWAADIKLSNQFIERSDDTDLYTAGYNENILDMAYPAVSGQLFDKVVEYGVYDTTHGYFVLGVIGDNIYNDFQKNIRT